MKGGGPVGYVEVPETLTPELLKAMTRNTVNTVNASTISNTSNADNKTSPKKGIFAILRKLCNLLKKFKKKKIKECLPTCPADNPSICCPEKAKFIFLLNNAVVLNINEPDEQECFKL
jgi:hypothetical protein